MKRFLLCLAVTALSVQAQPSPYRLLRPIMKDPNQRQAPSSVTAQDLNQAPPPATAEPAPPPKPVEIVAKIDAGLAASKVSLIGRITGVKGSLYVTNLTSDMVFPHLQFAILDRNGAPIATASKVGNVLAAQANERIDVIATNAGSVDVKLVKLSAK
ncbi:MAG TPA: hypothetical protein VHB20_19500 [Verrucomicrobiae bacterium]|nr:hypothetical protein [Verrucomicrobiae bacterium]